MQEESKDLKNIPKLGTIRKIRNVASTPEIARNLSETLPLHSVSRTISRSRVTLMPSDITQLQKIPKKKIAVDKQPIMPSQIVLDAQKKLDSEELELGLRYNEYLQIMMMDHILKKKIQEKSRIMVMLIAAIGQEIAQDTQKLIKIKTRERDIINLSLAQKEADDQLIAVTKYTEPLDVLQCKGIMLPETEMEWKEIQEISRKCSNVLKSTINLIGSKGETYCAVNAGLKNFTETYDEIKALQKKLEEALCNLQVLILKNASLSVACNDSE
ncbi:PREDICTED: uncharacterized protein LOC108772857 isoform X2 [Cyphomyrmex costatus]|uniref:uncharacterized protein LOC108772857 isoform X2 n=1 Tax=Cyphomyrmex costatus TaxID=456900 RepID=UPI0008523F1C|nr:PREDICTED: uncharacterized protein LOC108772857 isoform X2 [Cyphomyrmex costatus]